MRIKEETGQGTVYEGKRFNIGYIIESIMVEKLHKVKNHMHE